MKRFIPILEEIKIEAGQGIQSSATNDQKMDYNRILNNIQYVINVIKDSNL